MAPTADFDNSGHVDFTDFFLLADHYGISTGDPSYAAAYDLNSDGDINLRDFFLFADSFGQTIATKLALSENTTLDLLATQNGATNEIDVVVHLQGAEQIRGYHLQIDYDPATLELINTTGPQGSQFSAPGASGALTMKNRAGQSRLMDALRPEHALQGDTDLIHLRFRHLTGVLTGHIDIVQAQIADWQHPAAALLGASLDLSSLIPAEYALKPNYPNPFNPATTIVYQIPEAGDVSLTVYSALGQQVRTLVQANQPAGSYRVAWDGKDALGNGVSSGVYFYRFTSGLFSQTQRMMLLK